MIAMPLQGLRDSSLDSAPESTAVTDLIQTLVVPKVVTRHRPGLARISRAGKSPGAPGLAVLLPVPRVLGRALGAPHELPKLRLPAI